MLVTKKNLPSNAHLDLVDLWWSGMKEYWLKARRLVSTLSASSSMNVLMDMGYFELTIQVFVFFGANKFYWKWEWKNETCTALHEGITYSCVKSVGINQLKTKTLKLVFACLYPIVVAKLLVYRQVDQSTLA